MKTLIPLAVLTLLTWTTAARADEPAGRDARPTTATSAAVPAGAEWEVFKARVAAAQRNGTFPTVTRAVQGTDGTWRVTGPTAVAPVGTVSSSPSDAFFDQLRKDRRDLPNAAMGFLDSTDRDAANAQLRYQLRQLQAETTAAEASRAALQKALAGQSAALSPATRPEGAAAAVATTPPEPTPTHSDVLAWADAHFASVFLTLIGVCLAMTVPLRWLIRRGRGRAVVSGVFLFLLAGGVAQLFAAGVAFGANRPADAWATLLGCSAVLIVVPAMTLRQVRRQYDELELRRMRAMDVA